MGKPYRTCPDCGAALDPGEICDCRDPAYLTVNDVAARWSVSADLVYNLVHTGALHAIKLGSAWRIPHSAVMAYENDHNNQKKNSRKTRKRNLVLQV